MTSQTSPVQPAKLVALHPEVTPTEYFLTRKLCLMGRDNICQVVIPLKTVSRIHAIIKVEQSGHYSLRDGNSINGTYINGRRLTGLHKLQDRDEIGLGSAIPFLRFEILLWP